MRSKGGGDLLKIFRSLLEPLSDAPAALQAVYKLVKLQHVVLSQRLSQGGNHRTIKSLRHLGVLSNVVSPACVKPRLLTMKGGGGCSVLDIYKKR